MTLDETKQYVKAYTVYSYLTLIDSFREEGAKVTITDQYVTGTTLPLPVRAVLHLPEKYVNEKRDNKNISLSADNVLDILKNIAYVIQDIKGEQSWRLKRSD